MKHGFFWNYLWIAPHLLQAGVAVVIIARKLHRRFPIFFLYTGFEVLQFAVLFIMYHLPAVSVRDYFYVHWVGVGVSTTLRFGVIHEIFSHVFRNYAALAELGKLLFRWATVVLLLVAVVTAAYAPGESASRIAVGIYLLDRAVSIVQCGLLIFLFLFSSYFGLSWRNYVFGMALGLGVFASVELATAAIRIQIGLAVGDELFTLITMATYHCSVLIWLFYLLAPEPSPATVREIPHHDLQEWNHALERLLQR